MYFVDVDFDKVLLSVFTFLLGRQSLGRFFKKRKVLSLLTGLLFLTACAGYLVEAFRMGKGSGDEDDTFDEDDMFDDEEAEEA